MQELAKSENECEGLIMTINRDLYLNDLISRMYNGLVKVITGIRRCGKSYLVFKLFYDYLIKKGIPKERIITFAFDTDEDIDKLEKYHNDEPTKIYDKSNRIFLVNSKKFRAYINDLIIDDGPYYLLLDEIQLLDNFVGTLNSYLRKPNLDIYVTGSNSHLLSSDIITTFRGRGDQIKVYPLSFKEFYSAQKEIEFEKAYEDYTYYGGMPLILSMSSEKQKASYLSNLFTEIYIKDIVERNGIEDQDSFERLIDILASSIGSFTSPTNIENTFKSKSKIIYTRPTIKKHIGYLKDSFLIDEANRYDIKGRRYIKAKSKYYFSDIGLRNSRLNFREQDPAHIMENIIYNELKYRGYNIDVGSVEISEKNINQNYVRKQLEVDFVCYQESKKYYVQSVYSIEDIHKMEQEEKPLTNIRDYFKKIIVVRNNFKHYRKDNGILIIGLKEFLLDQNSLDL